MITYLKAEESWWSKMVELLEGADHQEVINWVLTSAGGDLLSNMKVKMVAVHRVVWRSSDRDF
jgi:hypothetical protein